MKKSPLKILKECETYFNTPFQNIILIAKEVYIDIEINDCFLLGGAVSYLLNLDFNFDGHYYYCTCRNSLYKVF